MVEPGVVTMESVALGWSSAGDVWALAGAEVTVIMAAIEHVCGLTPGVG